MLVGVTGLPIFRARRPKIPRTRSGIWRWSVSLPFVLSVVVLSVVGLDAGAVHGADETAPEEQLKSAFLYKFTHYAEWPSDRMGDDGAPVTMCVIGRDSLAEALELAVRGRESRGRPVAVKRLASADAAASCHVLFIGWSESWRISRALGRLANQPILTVGDADGFAHHGGMINLTKRGNRMRFEINRSAVERAGLHLSSQLLKLATLVDDQKAPGA